MKRSKNIFSKISFKIIWAIGVLVLTAPLFAISINAQTVQEKITDFSTVITVHTDSSLLVQETIVYDFGTNEKHGIYRDIPIKYETSLGNSSLKINVVSVTDEKKQQYQFSISGEGKNLRIKIGDPDVTISGMHEYIISYSVQRAIGYYDSFDEIYWNATGNEWIVPIEQATAQIILPQNVSTSTLQIACYYGVKGSIEKCNADNLSFASPRLLQAGEGLTVAVGFPKGIVSKPTTSQNILLFLKDNGIVAVPIITFFIMLQIWRKKGRDPKSNNPVVPEYESPDGLAPLEVSALRHTTIESKAISAEIIFLAIQGFIKISKLEKKTFLGFKNDDYELTKLKELPDTAPQFDKELMAGLFGAGPTIALSDLKNKFYKHIPKIQKDSINSVVSKKYFPEEPSKTIGKYIIVAVLIIIGGIIVSSFIHITNLIVFLSLLSCGLIVMFFGFAMSKVTPLGADTKKRVEGLKMYIDTAEKDRINFHNAPEKNPQLFEKLLPFAMVLGVEEKWAKQFESIYLTQPSWYSDPYSTHFNAVLLGSSLSSFNTAASSTLSSSPEGSGGGGSSGGGGGGGGGGSW